MFKGFVQLHRNDSLSFLKSNYANLFAFERWTPPLPLHFSTKLLNCARLTVVHMTNAVQFHLFKTVAKTHIFLLLVRKLNRRITRIIYLS